MVLLNIRKNIIQFIIQSQSGNYIIAESQNKISVIVTVQEQLKFRNCYKAVTSYSDADKILMDI